MHCTGVRGLKSCVQARNANGRRTFDVHTCQWPTKLYGFFFYYFNGTLLKKIKITM